MRSHLRVTALLSTLILAGCGATEPAAEAPPKDVAAPVAAQGPVAPTPPIEPSPIPSLPSTAKGDMDKKDDPRPPETRTKTEAKDVMAKPDTPR